MLTVVFYHCPGLGGIRKHRLDLDFYEEPSLLGLTYWSVGLGDLDPEPYAAQENPMGWALASWMQQPRETRVELRLRLVEKILRFVRAEEYQELLLDTLETYYKLKRQGAEAGRAAGALWEIWRGGGDGTDCTGADEGERAARR